MKILVLSSTFPYPPSKGGTQNRTFNLLKAIALSHEVTLITQLSNQVTEAEIAFLKELVRELMVFPEPEAAKLGIFSKIKRFSRFLTQGIPPNVLHLYSPEIQEWIDKAVENNRFDIITCEHSVNEIYIRPQWQNKITTVIDIHSSISLTWQDQLQTKVSQSPIRDRVYQPLLQRYEKQFLQKFSRIVVTTNEDKQHIQPFVPQKPIVVIANGVDLNLFPYRLQDPGGHNIVFVGTLDYFVNVDAACFFSQQVFPHLQQKFPDATLTLVGSNPTPEVLALSKENPAIQVTGKVPSVVEYLHQATVAIAPLRTGFGIKNKTLEYMAVGVCVVGSDRGLEGIDVDNNHTLLRALRANTVQEYCDAITLLFTDSQLRNKLSYNARQVIETEYTWTILANQYVELISSKQIPIGDK